MEGGMEFRWSISALWGNQDSLTDSSAAGLAGRHPQTLPASQERGRSFHRSAHQTPTGPERASRFIAVLSPSLHVPTPPTFARTPKTRRAWRGRGGVELTWDAVSNYA